MHEESNKEIPTSVKTPQGQKGTGALRDPIDPKDYRYEEIAKAVKAYGAPFKWEEIKIDKIKRYGKIRDQESRSSCVAETVATVLGRENELEEGKFIELASQSIYMEGWVAPDGGMYPRQGFLIGSEKGASIEVLLPSKGLSEEEMRKKDRERNSDRLVGRILRGGQAVALPKDLAVLGSLYMRGKAWGISFRWNGSLHHERPDLDPNGASGHEVTGTTVGLWKGKRGVFYQNSWGENWGLKGCGFIPEDQFMKGVDSLWYYEDLSNLPIVVDPKKPIYTFKKKMGVGSQGAEVAMLQRCLGYLTDAAGELFPLTTAPTGYYGGITFVAVERFQALRGIHRTGVVDDRTLVELNVVF